mgnify:CR=1 FL=1
MRTRHTMTISLPPEMLREVEVVRKAEHRTRSELVREALRTWGALDGARRHERRDGEVAPFPWGVVQVLRVSYLMKP